MNKLLVSASTFYTTKYHSLVFSDFKKIENHCSNRANFSSGRCKAVFKKYIFASFRVWCLFTLHVNYCYIMFDVSRKPSSILIDCVTPPRWGFLFPWLLWLLASTFALAIGRPTFLILPYHFSSLLCLSGSLLLKFSLSRHLSHYPFLSVHTSLIHLPYLGAVVCCDALHNGGVYGFSCFCWKIVCLSVFLPPITIYSALSILICRFRFSCSSLNFINMYIMSLSVQGIPHEP